MDDSADYSVLTGGGSRLLRPNSSGALSCRTSCYLLIRWLRVGLIVACFGAQIVCAFLSVNALPLLVTEVLLVRKALHGAGIVRYSFICL